jgi:hypothetical protein
VPEGRVRRRSLIACALLALAGAASAEAICAPGEAAPRVPGVLLDELVGWIATHTMYDVGVTWKNPPEIVFCGVGEIIDYEGRDLLVDPALRAAYDLPARRIHLVEPWSPDSLADRSVLLHELIHDVQLLNADWPCLAAPEWEAYRLQDLWLQEQGVTLPFDWPAIRRLSACPEAPG